MDNNEVTSPTAVLWSHYLDMLRESGNIMAISAYGDSQETAPEGVDYLFTALSAAYTICYHSNPDYPQLVPLCNQLIRLGGPSPDITYLYATISGEGTYRFFGNVNTIFAIDWQTGCNYIGFTDRPGATFSTKRLHEYDINSDGSFEVIISQIRPEGHTGNWLQLDPSANYMLVRNIAYHPNELNPQLAIERLDSQRPISPFSSDEMKQRLDRLVRWMQTNAMIFASIPKRQKEQNIVNRIEPFQFGAAEVEGQLYYDGLFELEEDEALVIEFEIGVCFYWNVQLNDLLWRSLDFVNCQTSLNGHIDRSDSDGMTRLVVCAKDPEVENWLDTLGHKQGDIFMRFLDIENTPKPIVKKVKFSDINQYLPSDTRRITLEQRSQSLRERRAGYQLRHHGW